jgi:methionine aminopeptidase
MVELTSATEIAAMRAAGRLVARTLAAVAAAAGRAVTRPWYSRSPSSRA